MKIERTEIALWDRKAAHEALFPDGDAFMVGGYDFRHRLAESQNWRCCYCGVSMNRWRKGPTLCTVEHVIPASAGGRVCWETCVAACFKCNTADGSRLAAESRLRLTVPLCAGCGSDDIHPIRIRFTRCHQCGRTMVTNGTPGLPFSNPPFGTLRRTVGEMLVANADVRRVADRVNRKFLRLSYLPVVFAGSLMRLATPTIEVARAQSDCLVEIYDRTIAELRRNYTPETAGAPEREPLAGIMTEHAEHDIRVPFNRPVGATEQPKDGQSVRRMQ